MLSFTEIEADQSNLRPVIIDLLDLLFETYSSSRLVRRQSARVARIEGLFKKVCFRSIILELTAGVYRARTELYPEDDLTQRQIGGVDENIFQASQYLKNKKEYQEVLKLAARYRRGDQIDPPVLCHSAKFGWISVDGDHRLTAFSLAHDGQGSLKTYEVITPIEPS